MANGKIKPYDDVWNLPKVSYYAVDPDGNQVLVQPKNPAHHTIGHDVEQNATLFHNLGEIITNPDDIEISTSKHPLAIAGREEGTIKIYKRKNFIAELQIPGFVNWKGDLTQVVVLYPNDPTEENYTKTYNVFDEI